MFATFSAAPRSDAARAPVRDMIRQFLRFGLYAASHREMPVVLHLFEQPR